MRALLGRVRKVVSALFYEFGIHCATHQIRVILICAVVITSLFYPALAIYTSSSFKPLSAYLVPAGWRADGGLLEDLQDPWAPHPDLRVADDYDSRLRCGRDATVRVERVVVESVHRRADGALNPATLHAALALEARIGAALRQPGAPPCVETATGAGAGECFVLSPLQYWAHNADALARDADVLATVNRAQKQNVSADGILSTPEMLLGSITWSDDGGDTDIAQAEVLVATYFFQDTDCDISQSHAVWNNLLATAVGETAELKVQRSEPVLLPLQYHTHLSVASRFSVISAFLYLTYIVVFFNFSGSMRSVDTVHSRIGLAFTGLVEILASTITSISVLALWGVRITLVPWGILPLIIVFVGAENMFFMINSVVKTAVTMPVKERIALGVSESGTSNTLKVVTYNTVLGSLAFFAGPGSAIRQFCMFATVVLVAHWFLIHTLFLTVLSIDLQRLELSDVLRQDPGLSPANSSGSGKGASPIRGRGPGSSVQRLVRSRATKDGSLLLILAVTVILYYVTYPTSQVPAELDPFARHSQRTTSSVASAAKMTPALRLWQTLNPLGKQLVHLRVEPPTLVRWVSDGADPSWSPPVLSPARKLLSFSSRRMRAVVWAIKIIVLPIAGTCGALYALLIHLLKNTELLEVQRARPNSQGGDAADDSDEDAGVGGAVFGTLPRAFAGDAEIVAVAQDAGTCVGVSADGVLALWESDGTPLSGVAVEGSLGAPSALAIDAAGLCVAVGGSSGAVGLWVVDLVQGLTCTPRILALDNLRSPVAELGFLHHFDSAAGNASLSLVVTYENGAVVDWDLSASPRPVSTLVQSSTQDTSASRAFLIQDYERSAVGVALALDSGTIEIVDCVKGPGVWTATSSIPAGPFHDPVVQLARVRFDVLDAPVPRVVVITLSRAGLLRVWDAQSGELAVHVDVIKPGKNARALQAAALLPGDTACERCREQANGGFVLVVGAEDTARVYRALVGERCACALAGSVGMRAASGGRRSRAGSVAPPSLRVRASLQQSRTPGEFPISGHGFHSRRSSEKDHRRPVLVPDEETLPSDPDAAVAGGRWKDLAVRCIADVPIERGAWTLRGKQVVGVRRRARAAAAGAVALAPPVPPLPGESSALSAAVLQRWEAWSLDLCQLAPVVRVSTLYALSVASSGLSRHSSFSSPRLSRNPSISTLTAATTTSSSTIDDSKFPRLPFTRASGMRVTKNRCFVGLGNTVGVLSLPPQGARAHAALSTAGSSPVVSRRSSVSTLRSGLL